jgi:diadenosine tetraphosphate (Ap4A) HIT family hydrolase
MPLPTADPSCFICQIADGMGGGQWYDVALAESETGLVVPALGAIAVGHVLVGPKGHFHSAQNMPADERADFIGLLENTVKYLAQNCESVTVFEHGASLAGSGPRSACSEHAHVQALPGSHGLPSAVEPVEHYGSLRDFYAEPPRFYPYLMAYESHGPVTLARDLGQSQFFRRELLRRHGDPDRWDYWLFPRDHNVRATIELFRGSVLPATTQPPDSPAPS